MDVCPTSGPASPLHIVATCRAEALLPTPSPSKSLTITCLTVVLALCDNCTFSKELHSKPTAFSSFLVYLVFSLALPALLSRVTVFCFRHASHAYRRSCRLLVPVLEGFSLENSGEWGDPAGKRDYTSTGKFGRVMSQRRTALPALTSSKLVPVLWTAFKGR